MAIENRNIGPGTKLVGRYHKEDHFAEVVDVGEGKVGFRVDGGEAIYGSPSSAAASLMNNVAVNGWRFWSIEGEATERPEAPPAAPKPKRTATKGTTTARRPRGSNKMIKPVRNQTGVMPGQTKFFCSGCMSSFLADAGTTPEACPMGHRNDAPDEFAVPENEELIASDEESEQPAPEPGIVDIEATEAPSPEEVLID